jgi:hypothetical protein
MLAKACSSRSPMRSPQRALRFCFSVIRRGAAEQLRGADGEWPWRHSSVRTPAAATPHRSRMSFGENGMRLNVPPQRQPIPMSLSRYGLYGCIPHLSQVQISGPEPVAARNECRAGRVGDLDGFLAALMRELVRSATPNAL